MLFASRQLVWLKHSQHIDFLKFILGLRLYKIVNLCTGAWGKNLYNICGYHGISNFICSNYWPIFNFAAKADWIEGVYYNGIRWQEENGRTRENFTGTYRRYVHVFVFVCLFFEALFFGEGDSPTRFSGKKHWTKWPVIKPSAAMMKQHVTNISQDFPNY